MKKNQQLGKAIATLVNPVCVLPGKVREVSVTCGTPGCKCMKQDNPQKHLSRQMSYTNERKTKTLFVKKADVALIEIMNSNYKRLRESTTIFAHEATKMVKAYGLAKTEEIIQDSIEREKRISIGLKNESCVARKTRISCEKWKTKAIKRKSEIEKLKIKVRDLNKSRESWKIKAIHKKEENQGLIRELENIKKKLYGKKQCLLVLGIPLVKYRKKNHKLRHEDMEVLAADIVESATGKSVTNSLEKIAKNTGRPV